MINRGIRLPAITKILLPSLFAITLLSCDGSALSSSEPQGVGCEAYKGLKLKGHYLHMATTPPIGELPVFQLPIDSSTVNYTLGDGKPQQARFKCSDGLFEVVSFLDQADIIVSQGLTFGPFIDLALDSSPGLYTFIDVGEQDLVCTLDYSPVCAVTALEFDDFCDADCPFGKLKTFSNACNAEGQGALITQYSDCGEKEGQVYTAN